MNERKQIQTNRRIEKFISDEYHDKIGMNVERKGIKRKGKGDKK